MMIEHDFDREWYQEVIDLCMRYDDIFSAWELDFISSQHERLELDSQYTPSEKQRDIYTRLHTKLLTHGFTQ